MLDLRLIREDPERVKAVIATTYTEAPLDEIVALDERRRALLTDVESLKAELNQGSKEVGRTPGTIWFPRASRATIAKGVSSLPKRG